MSNSAQALITSENVMKSVIDCKSCLKMRLYSHPALYRLQDTQHQQRDTTAYRGTRLSSAAGTEDT